MHGFTCASNARPYAISVSDEANTEAAVPLENVAKVALAIDGCARSEWKRSKEGAAEYMSVFGLEKRVPQAWLIGMRDAVVSLRHAHSMLTGEGRHAP